MLQHFVRTRLCKDEVEFGGVGDLSSAEVGPSEGVVDADVDVLLDEEEGGMS